MIQREELRAVCPVDEVHGIHHFQPQQLQDVPATVAKSASTYTRKILPWRERFRRAPERPASVHRPEAELRMSVDDLKHVSMIDLFRLDAEGQAQVLTSGPSRAGARSDSRRSARGMHARGPFPQRGGPHRRPDRRRACCARARRLLCGRAGRAHRLTQHDIDRLLRGVDLLVLIAKTPEADTEQWNGEKSGDIDACLATLEAVLAAVRKP